MKLGLVGLGYICVAQHTPALMKYAREVAPIDFALCDPSAERRAEWQERFGKYPAYASAHDMLQHETLDAAYVLVPPEVTCEVAQTFLRAGIPTFTEKPPGLNRGETERLIGAAEGTVHAVGFNRRFSPLIRRMKEIVLAEKTGPALLLGCEFTRVGRYDPDFTTTLIHGLDALRHLGGNLAALSARIILREGPSALSAGSKGKKPFRSYTIHGAFASGALMEMQGFPVSGVAVERYTLVARDLTVRTSLAGLGDAGEVAVYREGKLAERYSEADLGLSDAPECVRFGFYDQARRFLDAVRSPEALRGGLGGPAGTTFRETLQSMELADFLRACGDAGEWRAHPLKGKIRTPKPARRSLGEGGAE
jgi:predicted dehydrogenase